MAAQDISTLLLKVTSDGIKEGTKDLNSLAKAADKAEVAVKKLGTAVVLSNSQFTSGTATAAAMLAAMEMLARTMQTLAERQTTATRSTRAHNDSMREGQALARGLSGSLGALWVTYGSFTGMAVGLAIGASLKGIVTVGSDVEHTLEGIRVKGQETVESISAIRNSVMELGKGIYGPQEVAKAFETLILAGLSAKQALSGITDALNLATVGGTSIEKSAYTIVQVGTALGYASTNYNRIADVIAKTAAVSMSSVESLSEAFKSGSAIGKLYGVSLEDIGTSLASLSNLGIQGSAAGTSLKNFYKEIAAGTDKVKATLKSMKLTPDSFKDDEGNFKSLLEVVQILDGGLSNLTLRQQKLAIANLSNERGMKTAVEVLELYRKKIENSTGSVEEHTNQLAEMRKQIEESYGFAAIGAAAMALTVQSQFKSVGNTLQTVFVEAFKQVSPQLTGVATALKAAFNKPEFTIMLVSLAKAVGDFTLMLVENIPLLIDMGKALLAMKAFGFLVGFFTNLGTAFTAASAGAAALGISLGPIAVALLAAGAAYMFFTRKREENGMSTTQKTAIQYSNDYANSLDEEAKRLRTQIDLMNEGKTARDAETESMARQAIALAHLQGDKAKNDAQERYNKARANVTDAEIKISEDIVKRGGMLTANVQELDRAQRNLNLVNSAVERGYERIDRGQKLVIANSKELEEKRRKEAADASKKAIDDAKGTGTLGDGPDTQAVNRAYRTAIKDQDNIIKAANRSFKELDEQSNADFKAGRLGRMEVIDLLANKELAVTKTVADAISAKMKLASKAGKTDDVERFDGEKDANADKAVQTEIMREKNKQAEITAVRQEAARYHVKMLEDEGQYGQAAYEKFIIEQSAMFESATADAIAYGDTFPELWTKVNNFSKRAQEAVASGKFKEAFAAFELAAAKTGNAIKGVQTATENGGIAGMWKAAEAASVQYAAGIEDMKVKQAELEKLAANGSTADKTKAQEALKQITAEAEKYKNMWVGIGESIGNSLESGFGRSGKAMGDLVKATINFDKLSNKSETARVKYYGDAADAAKGFFSEGSRGYKTLEGVSKVFHMAEMANTLGLINLKAIMAVMNQGGGDPYTAFARMAAMAAVVGALGFAVGGGFKSDGGGGVKAEDAQKTQGTGSVFGDAEAKSESISKSIEALESHASLMLPLTSAMLQSLKNIEASMTGLTNLVLRTDGVKEGTNFGVKEGTTKSSMGWATAIVLGGIAAPILKLIGGLWGKTTTNIVDSGIQFGGKVSDLQQGKGYDQYASVDTTKSSWFGLSKKTTNSVQTQGLSDELSSQFGLIFTNLEDTLKIAAPALGKNVDDVSKSIDNLVLSTSNVSLKGLQGDDLQKAINGVVSKAMDEIAESAFPAMGAFRQVGEGYAQTVIRVASGIEQAKLALKEFNIGAIDYTQITKKTGDVMAEIVQQSIAIKEGSSGVGAIMAGIVGTGTELIDMYRELTTVRKSMSDMGLGNNLNIETVTAAGGLDKLSSSVKSYYEKFFSDEERLAIETKNVTESFQAIGKALPESRAQLRSWIEAAASIGDQTQVGKLLSLAQAFDSVASGAGSASDNLKKLKELQDELAILQGRGAEVAARNRQEELAALMKIDPVMAGIKKQIFELTDAQAKAAALSKMQVELLTAQGNAEGALAITRKDEMDALMKVNPELKAMKEQLWAIADATTAFNKAMTVVDAAMKRLQTSVNSEKEKVNKDYEDKKTLLTAAQDAEKEALSAAHQARVDAIKATGDLEHDAAVASYKAQKDANDVQLDATKKLVDSASRLISSLKSAIEATANYDQVQARSKALATVRGATASSDAGNFAGIDDAIKELQKPSEALFSSLFDYKASQAEANVALTNLEAVATTQMTDAQRQIEQLTAIGTQLEALGSSVPNSISAAASAQIEAENKLYEDAQKLMETRHKEEQDKLEKARDDQLKFLDSLVTYAQQQVDQLNNIDSSILSLLDGMYGFTMALVAAQAAKGDVETAKLPSLDVGTNYLPEDQIVLAHKGERIIPAADNAELMRRMSNDEKEAGEVSNGSLQASVVELIEIIKIGDTANVQKTNELLKIIRDWDRQGQPPVRSDT